MVDRKENPETMIDGEDASARFAMPTSGNFQGMAVVEVKFSRESSRDVREVRFCSVNARPQ